MQTVTSRQLDILESEMLLGRAIPINVQYRGSLDTAAMSQAWNKLCSNHPVLCGRIRSEKDRYVLYLPDNHIPKMTVYNGSDETLKKLVNGVWDTEIALSKLMVIRDGDRGYITLLIDHAIVDGAAVLSLIKELWSLYTAVVHGSAEDKSHARGVALPRPPTELLDERWKSLDVQRLVTESKRAENSSEAAWRRMPSEADQVTPVHRRLVLNRDETRRLRDAARRHKTSVHGILCGTVLVALRMQGSGENPVPMACWTMVDLRSRVRPIVAPTETTNFLAFHRSEVEVGSDPIKVAQAITQKLSLDLREKNLPLLMSSLRGSRIATPLEPHLANASISNARVIERFESPSDIEIIDLFVMLAEHSTTPFPVHGVVTYDGRLSISSSYPSTLFAGSEVDEIEMIKQNLLTTV